jgi:DNA-binding response OmpR family regulator
MAVRILIVDDEPSIVIPLEYLMQREGYEVTTATDGEAALQAVAERVPDLVILDVMLPRMSGFDVCRALRSDPRHGRLRILMLSAKGRESEVSKGLALGADAYVTKPFSTRELVVRVRQLLGGEP